MPGLWVPEYNLRWARFLGRETPEQLASDRVDKNRTTGGGGSNHAKLSTYRSERNFRVVANKSGARRRVIVDIWRVAYDTLSPSVPVPEQQCCVF